MAETRGEIQDGVNDIADGAGRVTDGVLDLAEGFSRLIGRGFKRAGRTVTGGLKAIAPWAAYGTYFVAAGATAAVLALSGVGAAAVLGTLGVALPHIAVAALWTAPVAAAAFSHKARAFAKHVVMRVGSVASDMVTDSLHRLAQMAHAGFGLVADLSDDFGDLFRHSEHGHAGHHEHDSHTQPASTPQEPELTRWQKAQATRAVNEAARYGQAYVSIRTLQGSSKKVVEQARQIAADALGSGQPQNDHRGRALQYGIKRDGLRRVATGQVKTVKGIQNALGRTWELGEQVRVASESSHGQRAARQAAVLQYA